MVYPASVTVSLIDVLVVLHHAVYVSLSCACLPSGCYVVLLYVCPRSLSFLSQEVIMAVTQFTSHFSDEPSLGCSPLGFTEHWGRILLYRVGQKMGPRSHDHNSVSS